MQVKMMVFSIIAIITSLSSVSWVVGKGMGRAGILDYQKVSSFECGYNVLVSSRVNFSSQIFVLTLLFLIFDIEIIFILPFPLVPVKSLVFSSGSSILVVIFFLGMFIEWWQGQLEWV